MRHLLYYLSFSLIVASCLYISGCRAKENQMDNLIKTGIVKSVTVFYNTIEKGDMQGFMGFIPQALGDEMFSKNSYEGVGDSLGTAMMMCYSVNKGESKITYKDLKAEVISFTENSARVNMTYTIEMNLKGTAKPPFSQVDILELKKEQNKWLVEKLSTVNK